MNPVCSSRLSGTDSNSQDTTTDLAMSDPSYISLNVGGFQYKIKRDVLLGFTDSFFSKMLNSGWKEASNDAVVEIQRSGELFKFVYDYMFYGKLPRNEVGISLLGDVTLLKEVMQEADFYNLPGLVAECEELLQTCEAEQRIKHYATVLAEIEDAKSTLFYGGYEVVYEKTEPGSLLSLLRSNPFIPAWVCGTLSNDCDSKIFMSSTVQNVNVTELIAAASPSPFGRGAETILDTNVRNSMEIPASKLCDLKEIVKSINIASLAPKMKLTLKPYKLVIYQPGGHFDNHRDTVRDKQHIGTLVLILNSEYDGGALEVSHGQQNVQVTGALNWVAMYGDCVHVIHPITSGTRVSLIFDIWNEPDERKPASKKGSRKRQVDEEFEEGFWPDNQINTEFWCSKDESTTEEPATKPATKSNPTPILALDHDVWNRIYLALDKHLEKHTTVSICLEHLYPACQANPNFLKGADEKLYDMLKDKYSVGVTTITIARSALDGDTNIGFTEFGSGELLDLDSKKNILFVPNAMHKNSVLYYLPESEYTGNEAQAQELVYLVAALVVRKT